MRLLVALACLGGCSLIVEPPDASDTLVNTTVELDQSDPSTVFVDGRYLVVWEDDSRAPPARLGSAIRGRFVGKTGVPQRGDDDFVLSLTTVGEQRHPRIAATATQVLVAWNSNSTLKGRIGSVTGDFAGSEIEINTTPASHQDVALVATDSSFMLVWTDATTTPVNGKSIRGRMIDANGMGALDVVLSPPTKNDQTTAAIARGRDKQMLVVWTSAPAGGAPFEVRGRMLESDGSPAGDDFAISSNPAGQRQEPFAVALRDGGYLVAWTEPNGDREGTAVRARVLEADGDPRGTDFTINTTVAGDQAAPKAIAVSDGAIYVAFEDRSLTEPDTDENSIRVRRLESDGTPTGNDFLVNTIYERDQEDVALAADGDGGLFAVWEDGSAAAPDGSGNGIRSRLYPATALRR